MLIVNNYFEIFFLKKKKQEYDFDDHVEERPLFSFDAYFANDYFFRLPEFKDNNKNRRKNFMIVIKIFRDYYLSLRIKLWRLK